MRSIRLSLLLLFITGAALAQPVAAPRLQARDSWVYRNVSDGRGGWRQADVEISVVRTGTASIVAGNRMVGAPTPLVERITGPDWSLSRSINGREVVVNRPFAFPLTAGKTWDVDYTEEEPSRQLARRQSRHVYRVIGWEEVTVPAGTFRALKIEAEGQWTLTSAAATTSSINSRVDSRGSQILAQTGTPASSTATGRAYRAYWYVPTVRRWVRSVEETYDSSGGKSDGVVSELLSYRLVD